MVEDIYILFLLTAFLLMIVIMSSQQLREADANVVTAAATILLAGATTYLALMGYRQLSEMRAEQRPWIAVKVEPAGNLVISESSISLKVAYAMTNTGRAPATFAWPELGYVPNVLNQQPGSVQRPLRCESKQVEDLLGNSSTAVQGVAIFPQQTIVVNLPMTLDRRSVEKYAEVAGKKGITPLIVGCIRYHDVSENLWHRTGFIYVIGYIDHEHEAPRIILLEDGNIPTENVSFTPWTEDGGRGFFAN